MVPTIIDIHVIYYRIGDLTLEFQLVMAYSVYISSLNFNLSWFEHQKIFTTTWPDMAQVGLKISALANK